MFYKVGLLKNFGKLTGLHHQACNFIKKRLQGKRFTVNFSKLLKAPCGTPPVSASDFNVTFLTLRR